MSETEFNTGSIAWSYSDFEKNNWFIDIEAVNESHILLVTYEDPDSENWVAATIDISEDDAPVTIHQTTTQPENLTAGSTYWAYSSGSTWYAYTMDGDEIANVDVGDSITALEYVPHEKLLFIATDAEGGDVYCYELTGSLITQWNIDEDDENSETDTAAPVSGLAHTPEAGGNSGHIAAWKFDDIYGYDIDDIIDGVTDSLWGGEVDNLGSIQHGIDVTHYTTDSDQTYWNYYGLRDITVYEVRVTFGTDGWTVASTSADLVDEDIGFKGDVNETIGDSSLTHGISAERAPNGYSGAEEIHQYLIGDSNGSVLLSDNDGPYWGHRLHNTLRASNALGTQHSYISGVAHLPESGLIASVDALGAILVFDPAGRDSLDVGGGGESGGTGFDTDRTRLG